LWHLKWEQEGRFQYTQRDCFSMILLWGTVLIDQWMTSQPTSHPSLGNSFDQLVLNLPTNLIHLSLSLGDSFDQLLDELPPWNWCASTAGEDKAKAGEDKAKRWKGSEGAQAFLPAPSKRILLSQAPINGINIATHEFLHCLLNSEFSSFLNHQSLISFSMMNNHTQTSFLPIINNKVMFKMLKESFKHYRPTRLPCPSAETLAHLLRNIKHIHFGPSFRSSVDNLPVCLTHLSFENLWQFKLPTEHLPSTLIHLSYGSNYDQPIRNLLSFISPLLKFNQLVALTHLFLVMGFRQRITHFPPSITHLRLPYHFQGLWKDSLPPLSTLISREIKILLSNWKHGSSGTLRFIYPTFAICCEVQPSLHSTHETKLPAYIFSLTPTKTKEFLAWDASFNNLFV